MLGDSHVCGKIYPRATERVIKERYPETEFSFWGKNGICFHSVNSHPEYLDTLFNFKPEIMIVHLGTNGAYTTRFSGEAFRTEIETFYQYLKANIPDCKIIFVTPFTNMLRKYRKRGKRYVNKNNRAASDEILAFAKECQDTYVIDNNADADLYFLETRGLIRPDKVHLTEAGYLILGSQVGEAVLAINDLWEERPKIITTPSEVEPAISAETLE